MDIVEFPKLGLKFNISRSISIGKFSIYWYGIIICAGILLCVILGTRFAKKYALNSDTIIDYLLVALPSAIIGARLYYVIFEWKNYYKANPSKIIAIWEGGLAIYGGIIGALLAVFIMAKIRKDRFLHLTDFAMPFIMLGQSIGRWGNFVNQEAYGAATNLPWGMTGNNIRLEMGDSVLVHPTFLYESLWCMAGFIFLAIYRRKHQKNIGEITALYMIVYGVERAIVEGLRMDSLMLGNIRISQILSIILVFVGAAFFIDSRRNGNPLPTAEETEDEEEEAEPDHSLRIDTTEENTEDNTEDNTNE